jgi:FkbM family methyltransferase
MKKYVNGILNLLKLVLVKLFRIELKFTNYFLGKRKFYCQSGVEIFRTVNYGNEEAFLGTFLHFLQPNDIIWDVGASVGLVSIYAGEYVEKVVSFEPDDMIYNRLVKNIRLNGLQDKIEPKNIGISNMNGTVNLSSDGVNGKSPSISDLNRHSSSKPINVSTIDEIIMQKSTPIPTVLKIDIEGAETLALKGGQNFLSSDLKPRLLFMEIHPEFLLEFGSNESEVIELIKKYNYSIINYVKRDGQYHMIARFDE